MTGRGRAPGGSVYGHSAANHILAVPVPVVPCI